MSLAGSASAKAVLGLMAAALVAGCGGKSSADAGPTTPCGISPLGECSGTVLTYCDPNTLEAATIDCSQAISGEPFTCAFVDPYDGYDCEAPVGGACEFYDTTEAANDIIFCQGNEGGCLLSPTGASTCTTGLTPCPVYLDGGLPPATCISSDGGSGSAGSYLVIDCNSTQPVAYDCTAAGGTCLNEHCINQVQGAPCDDGATILCATGLQCIPIDGGATVCGSCTTLDGGGMVCTP